MRDEIEARILELIAQGTPHVVIDHFGLRRANTVSLDRAAGMAFVMEHLLDHRHRAFDLVGLSKVSGEGRADRRTGIHSALRPRAIDSMACTVSLSHMHECRNDFEYGRCVEHSFAKLAVRPSAFVVLNDEIAIGAIRGLQEAGLRIPRDVSVTGFSNQDVCLMTSPTLTTVDQNILATVTAPEEFILEQLGKPFLTKPVVKMTALRLVIGGSTGHAVVL